MEQAHREIRRHPQGQPVVAEIQQGIRPNLSGMGMGSFQQPGQHPIGRDGDVSRVITVLPTRLITTTDLEQIQPGIAERQC